MQLLDSHVEAGQELGEEDKRAYYTALVEYLYYGIEPELSGPAKAVFIAIKPTLDNSIARSRAGRSGGSKRASKTEANAKQARKQNGSKREANGEANENQNAENRGSYQDSPSPYSSQPSTHQVSGGCCYDGEGVQGEGFAPPTLDEVRGYFAANCLMGDPDAFFATYDSQGWVKGNGMPVRSWTSLALKWGIEERTREASKPPDQQKKPMPDAVNAPDTRLEDDIEAFERRYGLSLREGMRDGEAVASG